MIPRKLQIIVVSLVLAIFATGAYLIYLKHKAESISSPQVAGELNVPISGPAEQLVLYLPNDDADSLTATSIATALPSDPGERARFALRALISRCLQKDSPHPLAPGSDLHDVYLLDPTSAVVNLNAAFAQGHRSGIEAEQLTVFSFVLTLKAQLPKLTRVRFLVDGKQRDTLAGHIDLSGWYDIASVVQATSNK